jgi:aspartate dehydrogenase
LAGDSAPYFFTSGRRGGAIKIGIVGCGAIGRALLTAAQERRLAASVAGVTSRSDTRARAFLVTLAEPPPFLGLDDLIEAADLLVEAAGGDVVPELARRAVAAGKDLLVISVGALLEHPDVIDRARAAKCRLIVPSGAIAGLDGIKSACAGPVSYVRMTTRKPPKGLEGAPYLVERGISLGNLTEEREVFSGSARDACRGFPQNVNVSAAVSLAGIGPDRTSIRILAAPGLERNCHDIEVEGEFGRLGIHIENIPSENPRTGRLTMMSIMRAIQDAADPVRIGS